MTSRCNDVPIALATTCSPRTRRRDAPEFLDSIQRLGSLDAEVARSAIVSAQSDYVAEILAGDQPTSTLRLIQADAQSMSDDAAVRAAGAATLTGLLDDPDPDVRRSAAFALAAAASGDRDIAWNDRAADLLRADHPVALAMIRAMHLRRLDDREAAERELLPYVADHGALACSATSPPSARTGPRPRIVLVRPCGTVRRRAID